MILLFLLALDLALLVAAALFWHRAHLDAALIRESQARMAACECLACMAWTSAEREAICRLCRGLP